MACLPWCRSHGLSLSNSLSLSLSQPPNHPNMPVEITASINTQAGIRFDVHETHSKSVDSNEMRFRELQAISPEEISARWKP